MQLNQVNFFEAVLWVQLCVIIVSEKKHSHAACVAGSVTALTMAFCLYLPLAPLTTVLYFLELNTYLGSKVLFGAGVSHIYLT